MHGGLVKLEDFGLKLVIATFYVIIGGAVLVWSLDKLCDALNDLINLTLKDIVGFVVLMLIIIAVALLI